MPFVPDIPGKAPTDGPRASRFVPDAPVAAAPSAPAEPPAQPSTFDKVRDAGFDALKAVGSANAGASEMLLTAASKVPAAIAGGVTYGVQAARKAAGADVDPGASMHSVADSLSYKPRTESGRAGNQAVADTVGKVVKPIAKLGDAAATAVGKVSPTAETFMREAPDAASAALGVMPLAGVPAAAARGVKAGAEAVTEGAANVRGGTPIERGRAMGLKFRPSDVKATDPGAKVPGLKREGFSQPNDLRRDVTLENQVVTTREAATEIGAKTKNRLDPKEFDRLREAPLATYGAVGKAAGKFQPGPEFGASLDAVGNRAGLEPSARAAIKAQADQYKADSMDGPDAVKTISVLRRRATAQIRSKDISTQDMGHANRSIADAMENELSRQLEARGDAELHGQFQEARTALAKLHDVQSVTKAGQVDAVGLFKLKDRGVKLSGRLDTLADAAGAAPSVMRHSTKATGVGNSVKAETLMGAAKDVGKAAARKLIPGMDVTSERFQSKHFGRQATPSEQSYAGDAGKRQSFAPPREVKPDYPSVDFQQQGGVVPSRAQTLSGDLGLAPEPVANPQQLPAAPDMMSADVVPPVHGDINFTPTDLVNLAEALGLEQPRAAVPGSIDWQAPNLSQLMLGDRMAIQPPTYTGQAELEAFAPQRPRAELTPPPGRVGKPKGQRRGKG